MSLKQRIQNYFDKRPTDWVSKGDIQRLVSQHTNYTPENAGRRLRELREDGILEREIRRGHTFYRLRQEDPLQVARESVRAFEAA